MTSRQTRRKRSSFGAMREVMKKGRRYIEYSYLTPEWAFTKWPELNLPKRHTKTVTPERKWDGETWLHEAERSTKNGTWTPPKLQRQRRERDTTTFAQYAAWWQENRRKADGTPLRGTTLAKDRELLDAYLLPYFGHIPMLDITPEMIGEWFDTFQPINADTDRDKRRNAVLKCLRKILKAATEMRWKDGKPLLTANPCEIKARKHKRKHEPVRPTPEQYRALLDACPQWLRPIVMVCDEAGLREGEACGLQLGDIDLERKELHVRRNVQQEKDGNGKPRTVVYPPKTETSYRTVPMVEPLADMLREHISQHSITDPNAFLFIDPRTGGVAYPGKARSAFRTARGKVDGLHNIVMHDLRRDFLSRLGEHGASVAEIMQIGGHISMEVAALYQVTSAGHTAKVMHSIERSRAPRPKTDETQAEAVAALLNNVSVEERLQYLKNVEPWQRTAILDAMEPSARVETIDAMCA